MAKEDVQTYEDALGVIGNAYNAVNRLACASLFFRTTGLKPKKIITPENEDAIGWTLGSTVRGFQLTSHRSINDSRRRLELPLFPEVNDISHIGDVAIDKDDGIIQALHILLLGREFSDFVPEASVLAFKHFRWTLDSLIERTKVSYKDVLPVNEATQIGDYNEQQIDWDIPRHEGSVWRLMSSLAATVQRMCDGEENETDDILQAGIFFAAGSQNPLANK